MPFITCLGCNEQKRKKSDQFYCIKNIPNSIIFINNLRQTYNVRKRKLNELNEIPPQSKICRSCYDLRKQSHVLTSQQFEQNLNEADLSIYRKGINCHTRCTFSCSKNTDKLLSIPKIIRCKLLMNYKFVTKCNVCMCSEHIGISTYWPLVKQISQEVSAEEQRLVSDLMFEYYQELKEKDKVIFDINNIDSIDNETLKNWFAYNKKQFQLI